MDRLRVFVPFAAITLGAVLLTYAATTFYDEHQTTLFYSLDKKQNDEQVIKVIDGAQKYVYFAIYTFTKDDIADALVRAKKRGLVVAGIMDREQAAETFETSIIDELKSAGIPVEFQRHPDGIMHIKAVVTDRAYAAGSYNWTESATVANDEILEVGTDPYLRARYLEILKKIIATNAGGQEKSDSPAAPQTTGGTYDYTDAQNHIGETATVVGVPVDVYTSKSGTTFFDYCTDYKNCPFSAVIFGSDKARFGNVNGYSGKEILVTGLIKSYQGHAEMVLSDPGQIKVR